MLSPRIALAAGLLGLPLAAPIAQAQTATAFDDPALVRRYQATITPDELAGHLYVYASDYFEGRETGTRGQRLAALYLAGQYQTLGLAPKGTGVARGPHDPAVYLQPFALNREVVRQAALTASHGGQTMTSAYGMDGSDGDHYLLFGNAGTAVGPLVFGGYGVKTDRYDDYAALTTAGLSTAGSWLVLLNGEPMNADGTSRVTADGAPSAFTRNVFQKVRTAIQEGMPAGVLLVADEGEGVPSVAQRAAMSLQAMGSLSIPSDAAPRPPRALPPVYVVSRAFADRLLAPSGQTVAGLTRTIGGALAPTVFAVDGATVSSSVTKAMEPVQTENVAAFIEGSDPVLKNEVVVISAHLDHIGLTTSGDDAVNNGADDDGSGTVALLELAEAFHAARADGHGPRRSILFLHVTGEEKGLLGSAYYADVEPLLPLSTTVANLNIDMIGRHDPSYDGADKPYVYIIGAELISTDIDAINTRINRVTGLGIDLSKRYNSPTDPNRFFARSDHWNFGKNDVPFIFYFTGTHEDYHRPGDEPQKIDYDRMAQISRLVFGTAWQIANQDARPAVSGVGFN